MSNFWARKSVWELTVLLQLQLQFSCVCLLFCVIHRHARIHTRTHTKQSSTNIHTHARTQTNRSNNDPLSKWHLIVVLYTVCIIVMQHFCIIKISINLLNRIQYLFAFAHFACFSAVGALVCLWLCGEFLTDLNYFQYSGHTAHLTYTTHTTKYRYYR